MPLYTSANEINNESDHRKPSWNNKNNVSTNTVLPHPIEQNWNINKIYINQNSTQRDNGKIGDYSFFHNSMGS